VLALLPIMLLVASARRCKAQSISLLSLILWSYPAVIQNKLL
jgi:hypothetical protein